MHRHAALDVGETAGRSVNPRVSSDHVALCHRRSRISCCWRSLVPRCIPVRLHSSQQERK